MKNDLTCGVVQDLLPSYVEGLTSPESNTAVERHLSECPDCAQLRTALAGAPKLAAPEDAKEVDYLKKVKRRGWRRHCHRSGHRYRHSGGHPWRCER